MIEIAANVPETTSSKPGVAGVRQGGEEAVAGADVEQ
jgi:hypothetical protein